jgi:hypothetical protein
MLGRVQTQKEAWSPLLQPGPAVWLALLPRGIWVLRKVGVQGQGHSCGSSCNLGPAKVTTDFPVKSTAGREAGHPQPHQTPLSKVSKEA